MTFGRKLDPNLSDNAACRETWAYVDRTIQPPDYLVHADRRQEGAVHLARLILTGGRRPAPNGDPLLDLETCRQILLMLREASSAPFATRLDRAFAWAAEPSTAVEAAMVLGMQMMNLHGDDLPKDAAKAITKIAELPGYTAFLKRRHPGIVVPGQ